MADRVTQILLLPLMVDAACGLVLSLAEHLLSLAGLQAGGNALFFALHIGTFPTVVAGGSNLDEADQRDEGEQEIKTIGGYSCQDVPRG